MSIAVLEDNPARIKLFRQGFIGDSTTIITSAHMMISWLHDHTPRLLCLDYDLDQYGQDVEKVGTGMDAALYVTREHKRFARTLIVIHSINEKGGDKMLKLLLRSKLMVSRQPNLWESASNLERLARTARDL